MLRNRLKECLEGDFIRSQGKRATTLLNAAHSWLRMKWEESTEIFALKSLETDPQTIASDSDINTIDLIF